MSTTGNKRLDFVVDGKSYAITDGEVKDTDLDFIGEYINVTTSVLRKDDIGYNGELMNDKLPKLLNELGIYLYNNPKPYPSIYDPRSKTGMFEIGPELEEAERIYNEASAVTYRNPIIYKKKYSVLDCDPKRKTVWVTTGQCMGGEVEGYWKEVEG